MKRNISEENQLTIKYCPHLLLGNLTPSYKTIIYKFQSKIIINNNKITIYQVK